MKKIRANIIENADSLSRELKENWIIFRNDHVKFVSRMFFVIVILSIIFVILMMINHQGSINHSFKILGAIIGTVSVVGVINIFIFFLWILGRYLLYRWHLYQVINKSEFDFLQYAIEFDDKFLIEYENLSSGNNIQFPWNYFNKYYIQTESIKLFVGNRVFRTYSRGDLGDFGFDEMTRIVVKNIAKGKDDRLNNL